MPPTEIRSRQIKDGNVWRSDVNITQSGEALIRRLIAGTNISISSTGVDTGTGDVTVSVSSTPNFTTLSINGTQILDSSRNLSNIGTISVSGNITQTGTNLLHILNSTTANNNTYVGFQRSGALKGVVGNSWSNHGIINGSIQDDFCIRNSRDILFSVDSGSNLHARLGSSGLALASGLAFSVGGNTGVSDTFYFECLDGYYEMVVVGGIVISFQKV
jgi:hypothetical protein